MWDLYSSPPAFPAGSPGSSGAAHRPHRRAARERDRVLQVRRRQREAYRGVRVGPGHSACGPGARGRGGVRAVRDGERAGRALGTGCQRPGQLRDVAGTRGSTRAAVFGCSRQSSSTCCAACRRGERSGDERSGMVIEGRRYLVHRCRAGGIAAGVAQAYLVQAILGTPNAERTVPASRCRADASMDTVAEFSGQGCRSPGVGSYRFPPRTAGPWYAIELMKMLPLRLRLAEMACPPFPRRCTWLSAPSGDGLETACRIVALIEAYGTEVNDEMAVRCFDEYLNLAGEGASALIKAGDVKEFSVHWPSVLRRHLLLEKIRTTRPQRARDAVIQFCAAYTPDQ